MGKRNVCNRPNGKALVDKAFRSVLKTLSEATSMNEKNMVDDTNKRFLDSPFKERRKKVLVGYYKKAMDSFSKYVAEDSDINIFECFAYTELLPYYNYNLLDSWGALRIGAAMWMLDKITLQGKLNDVWNYIPNPNDVLGKEDKNHFYRVMHPIYPSQMVEAMALALTFRYLPDDAELKHYHLSSCVIPEEMVLDKPLNKSYQSLLKMIPEKEIEQVCEKFKEKIWECTELAMEVQSHFADQLAMYAQEIDYNKKASLPKIPMMTPTNFRRDKLSPNHSIFRVVTPTEKDDSVLQNLTRSIGTEFLIKEVSKCQNQFDDAVADFDTYLGEDKSVLKEMGLSDELCEKLSKFDIGDPFAMCFALFYLLDKKDDTPWLMYSGGALMSHVYSLLPWRDSESVNMVIKRLYQGEKIAEETKADTKEEDDGKTFDYYGEYINGLNLAQILYRTCKVVLPYGHSEFYHRVKKITDNQTDEDMTAHLSSMAGVLGMKCLGAHVRKEKPEKIDKEAEEQAKADKEKVAEAEVKVKEMQDKVDTITEENKKLKESLDWMNRKVDKSVTEFVEILEESEKNRKELADLRELLFNTENGIEEDEVNVQDKKDSEDETKYPYTLQKRMVVFGGHSTFLKKMRLNFPNARFMEDKFNPDVVKSADVVWIQTNSISHPLYWNVAKCANSYDVQLRYFTSAGVERCSQQLIDADQEN